MSQILHQVYNYQSSIPKWMLFTFTKFKNVWIQNYRNLNKKSILVCADPNAKYSKWRSLHVRNHEIDIRSFSTTTDRNQIWRANIFWHCCISAQYQESQTCPIFPRGNIRGPFLCIRPLLSQCWSSKICWISKILFLLLFFSSFSTVILAIIKPFPSAILMKGFINIRFVTTRINTSYRMLQH